MSTATTPAMAPTITGKTSLAVIRSLCMKGTIYLWVLAAVLSGALVGLLGFVVKGVFSLQSSFMKMRAIASLYVSFLPCYQRQSKHVSGSHASKILANATNSKIVRQWPPRLTVPRFRTAR